VNKITFFLLFAIQSTLCSQSVFQIAVGGPGYDYGYSIKPTLDGGYVSAGGVTTSELQVKDFYIVKLDAGGNLQWNRTVGGANYDGAYFVAQTIDGGYAIAGYTQSFGAGSDDFYIVKLRAGGSLEWNRAIGGSESDVALAIAGCRDGGCVAAGYTYSFGVGNRDYFIVKLDWKGDLQWSKTVGGTNFDYGESVIQTADGGYAVTGISYSFGAGNGDFYVVKLDSIGDVQWSRTVGGVEDDYCLSIIQTSDRGYALAGSTSSVRPGNIDFYAVKLDSAGGLQWARAFGGQSIDYAESIIQTFDGGYAVGGLTYSFGAGGMDAYIVRLDSSGNLLWSRTVGGTSNDYIESIIQTPDGGLVGAGDTWSFGWIEDMYIIKLGADGNTCGNFTSPQTASVSASGSTIMDQGPLVTSPSPTITTPSPIIGNIGSISAVCSELVGVPQVSNGIPESFELFQNYPNPFNQLTIISYSIGSSGQLSIASDIRLKVYDALGREIDVLVNEEMKPGSYQVKWDGTNYASGIYYYSLTAGDFKQTKTMVLIK
jgi:hypothetical protein